MVASSKLPTDMRWKRHKIAEIEIAEIALDKAIIFIVQISHMAMCNT